MRPVLLAVAVAALALAGCQTVAPAQREVNPETRPNCTRACEQVGMKLTGIIFVDEYGGCVCEIAPVAAGDDAGASAPPVAGQGAALSGGMVVIAAARQRQQRQASSTPSSPPPSAHH